jgi:hypothetical protein
MTEKFVSSEPALWLATCTTLTVRKRNLWIAQTATHNVKLDQNRMRALKHHSELVNKKSTHF